MLTNGHPHPPTPPAEFPNGTSPGNEISPVVLARDLETCMAQRDRALDLLHGLERILWRIGGYMEHDDQQTLRDARALLVECGRR